MIYVLKCNLHLITIFKKKIKKALIYSKMGLGRSCGPQGNQANKPHITSGFKLMDPASVQIPSPFHVFLSSFLLIISLIYVFLLDFFFSFS